MINEDENSVEELKLIAEHVLQRNCNSDRNSKVNLRMDPKRSGLSDYEPQSNIICEKHRSSGRRNRYIVIHDDASAMDQTVPTCTDDNGQILNMEVSNQCIMTFDKVMDSDSAQSSDISDDVLDDIDGIKVRTGIRTKSMEDLLSVMKIDDNERFHFLDNFKQILNNESRHLALLNTISKFKYILKESKVSDDILTSIFYNIDELIDAQNNLVLCLENMISQWDLNKHLFIDMMDLYELLHTRCKEYVRNIAHATTELRSLFEKNDKFVGAMHMVIYEGSPIRLEVLLAKPTNWLCNSLENIKSIIETAEGQCDVKMIKDILEKLKDNSDVKLPGHCCSMEKNAFNRSGIFIEILPNDQRRMRHLFLFSGMLICAKQRLQWDGIVVNKVPSQSPIESVGSNKSVCELKTIERLEAKWFIPIQNLVLQQSKIIENCEKRKSEIFMLKDKIRDLRIQLISEKAKVSEGEVPIFQEIKRSLTNNFSFRNIMIRKDVDKIQNLLIKTQKELMQLAPTISFFVGNLSEKPHHLRVFSAKELESWRKYLIESKNDPYFIDISNVTLANVSTFIESYRGHPSIVEVANAPLLVNFNDEGVSGVIAITIETVEGLNPVYSYYLSIEVDSYNLYEIRARTLPRSNSASLSWNESFELDLECSHTMNILLTQVKNYAEDKESLIAYFEFKLDVEDLNNKTVTKTTSMFNEDSVQLQIKVSFKIKNRYDLMKRQPSLTKTELFGVPIETIVEREKTRSNPPADNVPLFLYVCLKKIEDEGLDQEGIYRVSGNKNEISDFYKKLNKNVVATLKELANCDLHTVTGLVKLYFRELPEPLMLSENYMTFLKISNVVEEEERYKLYSDIIQKLPEPNHSTVIYVLKHLRRVVEHSNKNHMVPSNLGLIIGPTLMLPPSTLDKQSPTNFAQETMISMYMSRVFTQLMNGVCSGSVILDQTASSDE